MFPDVSEVITRNDIPLAKPRVDLLYAAAIAGLKIGFSFEIDKDYQVKILQYAKRNFPARIFTTTWYESKLYFQRLK